jgi:cytidine deaminase
MEFWGLKLRKQKDAIIDPQASGVLRALAGIELKSEGGNMMLSGFLRPQLARRRALAAVGGAGAGLLGWPLTPFWAGPFQGDTRGSVSQTLTQRSRDRLERLTHGPGFSGQIPAAEVEELARTEGKTVDALMVALLPVAQKYSRPPLSNYYVGAVVRGASGSLYLGANLEIAGQPLGFAVHAEQSALSNAYMHNEPGVVAIAVTAAPCGHCRQFLTELSPEGEI